MTLNWGWSLRNERQEWRATCAHRTYVVTRLPGGYWHAVSVDNPGRVDEGPPQTIHNGFDLQIAKTKCLEDAKKLVADIAAEAAGEAMRHFVNTEAPKDPRGGRYGWIRQGEEIAIVRGEEGGEYRRLFWLSVVEGHDGDPRFEDVVKLLVKALEDGW